MLDFQRKVFVHNFGVHVAVQWIVYRRKRVNINRNTLPVLQWTLFVFLFWLCGTLEVIMATNSNALGKCFFFNTCWKILSKIYNWTATDMSYYTTWRIHDYNFHWNVKKNQSIQIMLYVMGEKRYCVLDNRAIICWKHQQLYPISRNWKYLLLHR